MTSIAVLHFRRSKTGRQRQNLMTHANAEHRLYCMLVFDPFAYAFNYAFAFDRIAWTVAQKQAVVFVYAQVGCRPGQNVNAGAQFAQYAYLIVFHAKV